jgi:hypothetical protein
MYGKQSYHGYASGLAIPMSILVAVGYTSIICLQNYPFGRAEKLSQFKKCWS